MERKVLALATVSWVFVLWICLAPAAEEVKETVFDLRVSGETYWRATLAAASERVAQRESTCSNVGLLRMFPAHRGTLNSTQKSLSFQGNCFQSLGMQLSFVAPNSLRLQVSAQRSKSWTCFEVLIFVVFGQYYTDLIFMGGRHNYTFASMTPRDLANFDIFGLQIYTTCSDPSELLSDGFVLVNLFSDLLTQGNYGHRPGMSDSVVEFLNATMGYEIQRRPQAMPKLDFATDIHSGDVLASMETEGPGGFIMYSTGGRISHIAMALWESIGGVRTLYVVESQFDGITKTKIGDWLLLMRRINYCVVLLPLKKELAARFNEAAALQYFRTVEGSQYGWERFLFGWIDTESGNFPPPLTANMFLVGLSVLERSKPREAKLLFLAGLNQRLNTTGLDFVDAIREARKRGRSILQLFATPELESWRYQNRSALVCSSLVVMLLKAAGLINNSALQATEMTPRDLYSLALFDKAPRYLAHCKENDPGLEYCQLLGKFRIQLGAEYSSIPLGAHLFESCPSTPPLYQRTPGC